MIEQWVNQCRRGQTAAYAEIVKALRSSLLDFLYRMTRSREMAEDLGQEAFLRAFMRLDRFDERKASFSTWLFRIARNLCIDQFRKERHKWVSLDEGSEFEETRIPGPRAAADEKNLNRKIAAAIQELEPPHREVFILKEYEMMPLEEIAAIVDCPVGTVKSRLHRARAILQSRLAPVLTARQERRA